MTDAARDDQINAIVNQLANDAARRCGEDPDTVILAVSGLFAHMIGCFGIPNDRAHEMLAELLAQHEGGCHHG